VWLTAVFVFKEPMDATRLLSFCIIWTALALYTWASLKGERPRA
jgi:EamA domain-containing membrane protein RarD